MICGWQISSGGWTAPMAFCGERKGDGYPLCLEHYDDCMDEYGEVRMAPGNALGSPQWAVRLLWEPEDGDTPVEPTYEETIRYAVV